LGAIEAEDIFGEICNSNVKYLYWWGMLHPPEKCRTYLEDASGI
jgi:hypothetical protein